MLYSFALSSLRNDWTTWCCGSVDDIADEKLLMYTVDRHSFTSANKNCSKNCKLCVSTVTRVLHLQLSIVGFQHIWKLPLFNGFMLSVLQNTQVEPSLLGGFRSPHSFDYLMGLIILWGSRVTKRCRFFTGLGCLEGNPVDLLHCRA